MKRSRPVGLALGIISLCNVLIVFVAFAAFLTTRWHNRAIAASVTTTMVSSSGPMLNNFFDGIKPDPRYSPESIQAKSRALPECGKKKSSLHFKLFEIPTVYAQDMCPQTSCSGSEWVEYKDACDTGGPCRGTYWNTKNDPESQDGDYETGDNCGEDQACGCAWETCGG